MKRHENIDETDMYVDWKGFDEDILARYAGPRTDFTTTVQENGRLFPRLTAEETDEQRQARLASYDIGIASQQ